MHTTKVCKDFEINVLGEYHDLSIQRYRLLLADVFENFRDMCIEIYEPDAARFFLLQQDYHGKQLLKKSK